MDADIEIEIKTEKGESYGWVSKEQYDDMMWIFETESDCYEQIHTIFEGIKKAFDEVSE